MLFLAARGRKPDSLIELDTKYCHRYFREDATAAFGIPTIRIIANLTYPSPIHSLVWVQPWRCRCRWHWTDPFTQLARGTLVSGCLGNRYSVSLVRNKDVSIFIHADTKAANVILGIIKELCLVKISKSKIVKIETLFSSHTLMCIHQKCPHLPFVELSPRSGIGNIWE